MNLTLGQQSRCILQLMFFCIKLTFSIQYIFKNCEITNLCVADSAINMQNTSRKFDTKILDGCVKNTVHSLTLMRQTADVLNVN